ncbi:MAG: hypothetical protein IPK07_09015 [Deltaproteobacteria bacterium]|nr:hypothetical protein [Deltaproteobacteria bacterium]
MNAKRARLLRKYASATKRDPNELKKLWMEIPRTAKRAEEKNDADTSRRSLGAEIRRTIAASEG